MSVSPVPVRPNFGDRAIRLLVPHNGRVVAHIIKTGHFYEHELLEYIHGLQLKGTYIDVGAHIGNHTVFFSDLCSSDDVIAIEPNEENLSILRENTNNRSKVTVIGAAAGKDHNGTCIVRHGDKHGISTVDYKTKIIQRSEKMSCVSIDGIAGDKKVSLIKIDIHGDPSDVLLSAQKTIRRCRPVLVIDCVSKETEVEVAKILGKNMYFNVARLASSDVAVCFPVKFRVVFPMFNRIFTTMNLLRDLEREVSVVSKLGTVVDVCVYDDASTENVSEVVQFLRAHGWGYHRFNRNHGKRGFWEVVTKVFDDCRSMDDRDVLVMMANDVRICTKFFERALSVWNSIQDRSKSALNIQAEQYRDQVEQWTGFAPKRYNDVAWKTQWNDGMLLCPASTLRMVGYQIQKPNEVRWQTPNISSGVWQWFSQFLNGKGRTLYRVHESLSVHVIAQSSMHGGLRRKEPIRVARFVDGVGAYTRLLTTEKVFASLASIPSREENLKKVVQSLLPQVHVLRVYLNKYDKVPSFLKHERIVVGRSQDTGDFGDAGKFFWCEGDPGYQLTCDDDLIYADDYVVTCIEAIERFNRKAVVGLHGVILNEAPRKNYYDCRRVIHWSSQLQKDRPVHLIGTGTVAYHSSAVRLKRSDFQIPNMADIWLGVQCQKQRVPMVCIARRAGMLQLLKCDWTIYDRLHNRDEKQAEIVDSIARWQIYRG